MSIKKRLMRFAEGGKYDEIFDKHYRSVFKDEAVRENLTEIFDMVNQDGKWTIGNDSAGNIETNEYTKDGVVYQLKLDEDHLSLFGNAHRGEYNVYCCESVYIKYNEMDKIKQAIALEGPVMDEIEAGLSEDQEKEERRYEQRQEEERPMRELVEDKLSKLNNDELAEVLTDAFFGIDDIDSISHITGLIWDTLADSDCVELNKWLATFGWRLLSAENDEDVKYVMNWMAEDEEEEENKKEFFEENPDATEEDYKKDLTDRAMEEICCDMFAERLSDGAIGIIGASDACPQDLFFGGVDIDFDEDMLRKSLTYMFNVDREGFLKEMISDSNDRVNKKIINYINEKEM